MTQSEIQAAFDEAGEKSATRPAYEHWWQWVSGSRARPQGTVSDPYRTRRESLAARPEGKTYAMFLKIRYVKVCRDDVRKDRKDRKEKVRDGSEAVGDVRDAAGAAAVVS